MMLRLVVADVARSGGNHLFETLQSSSSSDSSLSEPKLAAFARTRPHPTRPDFLQVLLGVGPLSEESRAAILEAGATLDFVSVPPPPLHDADTWRRYCRVHWPLRGATKPRPRPESSVVGCDDGDGIEKGMGRGQAREGPESDSVVHAGYSQARPAVVAEVEVTASALDSLESKVESILKSGQGALLTLVDDNGKSREQAMDQKGVGGDSDQREGVGVDRGGPRQRGGKGRTRSRHSHQEMDIIREMDRRHLMPSSKHDVCSRHGYSDGNQDDDGDNIDGRAATLAESEAEVVGDCDNRDSRWCFVEFGAGKGAFSFQIQKVCAARGCASRHVMVDRMKLNSHSRRDGQMRGLANKTAPEQDPDALVVRIASDIAQLNREDLLPWVQGYHTVAVAKHLCGPATDLALESISECVEVGGRGDEGASSWGLAVATCCHHLISASDLRWGRAGKEGLFADFEGGRGLIWGLNDDEIALAARVSSWATLSSKHEFKGGETEGRSIRGFYGSGWDDRTRRRRLGAMCKLFFDNVRAELLRADGWQVELVRYTDRSAESILLVGQRCETGDSDANI